MEPITHCLLTGYPLQNTNVEYLDGGAIAYALPIVGQVRISLPLVMNFRASNEILHPVLAGICRNCFDAKQEPPLLTTDFVNCGLKSFDYPRDFKAKVRHFLKYLYDHGGNENRSFQFQSTSDYTICYADDQQAFTRIVDFAGDNYWVKWGKKHVLARSIAVYMSLQLTTFGISEVEKELPQIPMVGLVSQAIGTGDAATDEKINHAKDLFFREPQSPDRMRSACESLSFVLEPMREDLKQYFQKGDVSDFFNIVNNFDIRHNKDQTKSMVHPEQLEWVFYTLLNTINAYTKLKSRLGA